LIDLISNTELKAENENSKDLFGRVYEYFLGEFANAEGKKGGQFYTPCGSTFLSSLFSFSTTSIASSRVCPIVDSFAWSWICSHRANFDTKNSTYNKIFW
jgi:hypothetical protein